jgi:hypothetical protein
MTLPLTPTVIVLGPSAADSNACTNTALPINLSNLQCRLFSPRRLTQSLHIALDRQPPMQNKPPSARTRPPSPNSDCRRDFATIPIVPELPRLRSIRLL